MVIKKLRKGYYEKLYEKGRLRGQNERLFDRNFGFVFTSSNAGSIWMRCILRITKKEALKTE